MTTHGGDERQTEGQEGDEKKAPLKTDSSPSYRQSLSHRMHISFLLNDKPAVDEMAPLSDTRGHPASLFSRHNLEEEYISGGESRPVHTRIHAASPSVSCVLRGPYAENPSYGFRNEIVRRNINLPPPPGIPGGIDCTVRTSRNITQQLQGPRMYRFNLRMDNRKPMPVLQEKRLKKTKRIPSPSAHQPAKKKQKKQEEDSERDEEKVSSGSDSNPENATDSEEGEAEEGEGEAEPEPEAEREGEDNKEEKAGDRESRKKRKTRRRLRNEELFLLESAFEHNPRPNSMTRVQLAQMLMMSPQQVTYWYVYSTLLFSRPILTPCARYV